MSILGIDYGEKHVGVAISRGKLAQPLKTISCANAIQSIKSLIKQYEIDAVVVGDCPEFFLKQLSELGLVIHRADETLSTYDATRSLLHTSQSRRKNLEHAAAAAVILQHWLDASTDAQHQP